MTIKKLCSQVFVCSKEGHSKEAEIRFDGKNQENGINFEGTKKRKRQKEDSHIRKKIYHP